MDLRVKTVPKGQSQLARCVKSESQVISGLALAH